MSPASHQAGWNPIVFIMKIFRKIILASIFLPIIFFTLIYCGCKGNEKGASLEAVKLNSEAIQLISARQYDAASEKLSRAVEIEPDDKTYVTNYAFALYHSGRFEEAVKQYDHALQIDPSDPLVYLDYAVCFESAGYYDEALPLLLKAAEIGSGSSKFPDILFELAACHEAIGNRAGAISTLRRLVGVAPRTEYFDNLGDLLRDDGDLPGAEEAYRSAISLSPQYTPAMNNLGLLLCTTGRRDEGRMLFLMVLERDPNNHAAHNNLAMELRDEGDIEGAVKEMRLAVDADPENPLYHYHLALILIDAGKRDEAKVELRTALRIDPGFTDAETALKNL